MGGGPASPELSPGSPVEVRNDAQEGRCQRFCWESAGFGVKVQGPVGRRAVVPTPCRGYSRTVAGTRRRKSDVPARRSGSVATGGDAGRLRRKCSVSIFFSLSSSRHVTMEGVRCYGKEPGLGSVVEVRIQHSFNSTVHIGSIRYERGKYMQQTLRRPRRVLKPWSPPRTQNTDMASFQPFHIPTRPYK